MAKRIKDETLSHIKDVDVVRWAYVRAHKDGFVEDDLLSASPKKLVKMLGIDLPFAQRVSRVLRENEESRT
jgi:hypothetical protein